MILSASTSESLSVGHFWLWFWLITIGAVALNTALSCIPDHLGRVSKHAEGVRSFIFGLGAVALIVVFGMTYLGGDSHPSNSAYFLGHWHWLILVVLLIAYVIVYRLFTFLAYKFVAKPLNDRNDEEEKKKTVEEGRKKELRAAIMRSRRAVIEAGMIRDAAAEAAEAAEAKAAEQKDA